VHTASFSFRKPSPKLDCGTVAGRSPDPFVQAPGNPQNYNRFTYALNNPLKYIDPSGYIYKPDYWNTKPTFSPYFGPGYKGSIGPGSGNHWSDQNRSEWGNFMVRNQRSYDGMYGQGAYVLANEVYKNPDIRTQWISGQASLQNGFWVQSWEEEPYKDFGLHGGIQLPSFNLIHTFYGFKGNSGRVDEAAGGGGNNSIEYVGAVNDIALATVMGYNTLDNGLKRKYAHQLSKRINAKSGNIYQSAKSFGKGSAKVLGKTANFVAVGSITYDFISGEANTATIVDAGMLIGGTAAVFFIGTAAAPFVLGVGVVYGVGCLFGFDDYLNETLDISNSINFINY
jgi:hypothetical protein